MCELMCHHSTTAPQHHSTRNYSAVVMACVGSWYSYFFTLNRTDNTIQGGGASRWHQDLGPFHEAVSCLLHLFDSAIVNQLKQRRLLVAVGVEEILILPTWTTLAQDVS